MEETNFLRTRYIRRIAAEYWTYNKKSRHTYTTHLYNSAERGLLIAPSGRRRNRFKDRMDTQQVSRIPM